jgi:hypothetical protein
MVNCMEQPTTNNEGSLEAVFVRTELELAHSLLDVATVGLLLRTSYVSMLSI